MYRRPEGVYKIMKHDVRLGVVEAKFADIVWENAPLTTRQLVNICAEEPLNWKRTTTYTVLKKCCERGIFKMENSLVSVVMTKDEFRSIQSEHFVSDTFGGSLPAFIAAFTARKTPTEKELAEIRGMLDALQEA